MVQGCKGEPKDWSENIFDRNPGFQQQFSHAVSNEYISEAYNYFYPDVYDGSYLRMELYLPKRGEPDPKFARITKLICNANGLPIGKASDNPILDTHMYKVEYADIENFDLSANLIA